MVKALRKDAFKEIINTRKRFLSILLIVLLGVGFFAGIRAVSPDMKKTADMYFDENKMMDIEVISTMGLTDDDVKEIQDLQDVKIVEGTYSKDVLTKVDEEEVVLKIHTLSDNINCVKLQQGEMPKNEEECVVEESFLNSTNKKIGDTIILEAKDTLAGPNLKNKEIKIVGSIRSPLYISRERGSTKLASGKINYYIYVPKSEIASQIYTEMYVIVKGADKLDTFSDEYEDKIKKVKSDIENVAKERTESEYEKLKIKPEWYVLDRNQNTGYASYSQDSERIANIGKVFPFVFFVIAALISLTSMTRMVEEQRVQIGTLKALGYTKGKIALKYILYAVLATLIGGIIGMLIGFRILPEIIYNMYAMMYSMKDVVLEFNTGIAITGLGLALICTVGATIIACYKELNLQPASLMRPKSPKAGKRVLLERISWLWSKLKFTQKVTIRNVFRYKKRVSMTIIGILGCTALMVAGFGLRESVSNMIPSQYGEVFLYDMSITLKNEQTSNEIQKYIDEVCNIKTNDKNNDVTDAMAFNMQAVEILNKETKQDIQLIVPEKTDVLSDYIVLENRVSKEKYSLSDNGVVITEKLAKLLGIKQGEKITIKNSNDKQAEVEVKGITRNYLMHYMYISPEYYESIFGEKVKYNTILLKEQSEVKKSEESENKLGKKILENSNISKVTFMSQTKSIFDEVMDNMTFVVWILIISAGLLAFVVLYNLANVNISERIRELATIKVLGFYDKEVYDYVGRETTILTIIGILLGLVAGYFLEMFILKTCELDILMFDTRISIWSYVYSASLTILFTLIVSVVTYFALKKIDMIESLKSVE